MSAERPRRLLKRDCQSKTKSSPTIDKGRESRLLPADVSAPSKVERFSSGPDGDLSRPGVSATRNRTTSYLQVWRIISRSELERAHYRREVRGGTRTDEGGKHMGSFWKKMLRLSSTCAKGPTHGADFNASEVRRGFGEVLGPPWGTRGLSVRVCMFSQ